MDPQTVLENVRQVSDRFAADRKERQHRMYAHLADNDIDRWAERFLNALGESRGQPGMLSGLRQLFAQRA